MAALFCMFAAAKDASATGAPPGLLLPNRAVGPDELQRNMFDGDPDFVLGLRPAEIDEIIAERYSGWDLRRDHDVGINLRTDIVVPDVRRGTFLNDIMLGDHSENRLFNRTYVFGITSPLSGGEVYKINFDITSRNYGSAIASLPDWTNRQFSRRGMEADVLIHGGEFTLDYFYNGDGQALPTSSFPECHRATFGALTLYKHPPAEVKAAIKAIKRTGCVYRVFATAYLDAHGQVYRSNILVIDYRRMTNDALKRVEYGVAPTRAQVRKGR
jgi:hypothetical protein